MAEFVKTVDGAEKRFRKRLPELLRKAAEKYVRPSLLFSSRHVTSDVDYTNSYHLKDGCIKHELMIKDKGRFGAADHRINIGKIGR